MKGTMEFELFEKLNGINERKGRISRKIGRMMRRGGEVGRGNCRCGGRMMYSMKFGEESCNKCGEVHVTGVAIGVSLL